MINELKKLIEQSKRILITSHISPDPDAVSSVALLSETLLLNYPDKQIWAVLEEEPAGLDFIAGYSNLKFGSILEAVQSSKIDLFILLDANNCDRASRHDGQKLREHLLDNQIKTAAIDHHEEQGKDKLDIFINRQSPACVQDVYEICFDELELKEPDSAAQTAMFGFYADTGGFVFMKAGQQGRVFDFAKQLVDAGANVEQVKNQLEAYNGDDLSVLQELMKNISRQNSYSYSYLSDDFVNNWLKDKTQAQLQKGTNVFLNDYIRNVDGRVWGFIVYKNTLQGPDFYSVSFRAQGGAKDVAAIAAVLGGGGHKPAAGAKIKAGSLQEALDAVKSAIQLVE